MSKTSSFILLLLRLALAWIFLYSSISKIMAGNWTSAGFLEHATTFPSFFTWFALPQNIGLVDFLNVYGQLALGLSLLLGVFIPLAAIGGTLLMLLYYLAELHFPFVGEGTLSLLVDMHIIYSLCLILLWKMDAGKYYGLKTTVRRLLPHTLQKAV